jgi:hypothetical protein
MLRRVIFLCVFVLSLIPQIYAQSFVFEVLTARGRQLVFSDSVKSSDLAATMSQHAGYFRLTYDSEKFDFVFNLPTNYQGETGVEGTVSPPFLRKDAHISGVLTIKQPDGNLILLTKASKNVDTMPGTITQGVVVPANRAQMFQGVFWYFTFTYDEKEFRKVNYLVKIKVDMPVTIDWQTTNRRWVPENIPTPVFYTAPVVADTAAQPADTSLTPAQ